MAKIMKLSLICIVFFHLAFQVNAQPRGDVPRDTSGRAIPPTVPRGQRDSSGRLISPNGVIRENNNVSQPNRLIIRDRNAFLRSIIRKELNIEKEVSRPYSLLLKEKTNGIFKLLPADRCFKIKKLLEGECQWQTNYIKTTGANGYSFREKKNAPGLFADINYIGNNLVSKDSISQSILVDLGMENFENLNLESDGIKFLVKYNPETDIVKVSRQFVEILNGVVVESFSQNPAVKYVYSKSVSAKLNHIYATRTIFYNSEEYKNQTSDKRFSKNNFDIIAVFKIIDIDETGSLTIIWKELSKKDAPYLLLNRN